MCTALVDGASDPRNVVFCFVFFSEACRIASNTFSITIFPLMGPKGIQEHVACPGHCRDKKLQYTELCNSDFEITWRKEGSAMWK